MVEIDRNISIEAEKDKDSAYSTFLSAAPEMPIFSEKELAEGLDPDWQGRTVRLFRQAAERASSSSPS